MIHLQEIIMNFGEKPAITVLNKASLHVERNNWINIIGASGSGKTTFLKIIGGLLRPTEGTVLIDNKNIYEMDQKKVQEFRRSKIGFIYQDFKLFNQYTVLENVIVPQLPYKEKKKLEEKAKERLKEVGLNHRMNHFPASLSGGEKQRVAIARALLNNPDILLCDEPTGNLDNETTGTIMQIIQSLHDNGITIIFVTHDESLATYCDRLLTIREGDIKELMNHDAIIT